MKSLLLLAGTDNDDYQVLHDSTNSESRAVESWSTLKDAANGDEVWFYFPAPISAVVASGRATGDAQPGNNWPYTMPVGDLRWFQDPVTLEELRTQFPDWGWTQTARGRTYLSDPIARYLRDRQERPAIETEAAQAEATARERSPEDRTPAAAYRLNWNPDANPEDLTAEEVQECENFGFVNKTWRCGNARIHAGQRLFLMRTGSGPRGLVGIGRAISIPFPFEDDGDGRSVTCVSIRLTKLALTPIVALEELSTPPLDSVAWFSQTAGARLTEQQVAALEGLVGQFNDDPGLMPDELDQEIEYVEGACRQVTVNGFERNRRARVACLAHWGHRCNVCEVDFGARYGIQFENLIHVHHLIPLAQVGGEYQVDPIADLRPVCPNCHAMLHSRRPTPLSIAELKRIIDGNGRNTNAVDSSAT